MIPLISLPRSNIIRAGFLADLQRFTRLTLPLSNLIKVIRKGEPSCSFTDKSNWLYTSCLESDLNVTQILEKFLWNDSFQQISNSYLVFQKNTYKDFQERLKDTFNPRCTMYNVCMYMSLLVLYQGIKIIYIYTENFSIEIQKPSYYLVLSKIFFLQVSSTLESSRFKIVGKSDPEIKKIMLKKITGMHILHLWKEIRI